MLSTIWDPGISQQASKPEVVSSEIPEMTLEWAFGDLSSKTEHQSHSFNAIFWAESWDQI